MTGSTTVKLEQNGVFRRFELQLVDGKDALVTLVDAIKKIDPGFKAQLVWKDADGDSVLLGSDVEVREAVKQCQNGCLRVHMHDNNSMDSEDSTETVRESEKKGNLPWTELNKHHGRMSRSHWGIQCDGCGMLPIKGIRHTCNDCEDFDLCDTCKASDDHDTEHVFTAIEPVMRNWGMFRRFGPRGPHPPPHHIPPHHMPPHHPSPHHMPPPPHMPPHHPAAHDPHSEMGPHGPGHHEHLRMHHERHAEALGPHHGSERHDTHHGGKHNEKHHGSAGPHHGRHGQPGHHCGKNHGFGGRRRSCTPPRRGGCPGGMPPMFMNPMFMAGLPSMMEFMSVGQEQMENLTEDQKLAHVQQAAETLTQLAKSFLNVDLDINVVADATEPAADQIAPEVPSGMFCGILGGQGNGNTEEMVNNMQKMANYVAYMLRQHGDVKVKITVTAKTTSTEQSTTPAAEKMDTAQEPVIVSVKPTDEKDQAARNAEALSHLLRMGFTNESGWLSALVAAKHGNINQVLNAVQPHH